MENEQKQLRQFGNFRLDVQKKVLWYDNQPINLPLKEVELLCALTDNVGEVVTKDEILSKIWADSFVEESNLSRHIYLLRKTFKDHGESEDLIQTVPRRGYRFAGEIKLIEPGQTVVEKHSLTRTLIEEIPAAERQIGTGSLQLSKRSRVLAMASALVVVLLTGAVIAVKRSGEPSSSKRLVFASSQNTRTRTLAIIPFATHTSDYSANDSAIAADLTDAVRKQLASEPLINLIDADIVKAEMSIDNMLLKGRALAADVILTGTLFASQPDLHLRLHLLSVNGGEVLWATTYKHPVNQPKTLVNSLVDEITAALQKLRTPEEYERIASRHTANRDAYQLYLQARLHWDLRQDILVQNSIFYVDPGVEEPLKQAIALDANFAMAYVALADIYKGADYSAPEWRRAEEYALRATVLDPTLADPHATLGFIRLFHYWDWAEAEAEFKRAIELDPNCVTAHQWYALFHALRGNFYESQSEIAKAMKLAPYSLVISMDHGEMLFYAGKSDGYAATLEILQSVLQLYPASFRAREDIAKAYWMTGQFETANEYYSTRVKDGRPKSAQERARMFAGPPKGTRAFEEISHPETYMRARWYAILNQREEALDLLEKAYRDHHFFMVYIKAEPFFESLREEPRFQTLLRNVGLS